MSVVVPTYARPERLRACVAHLGALDYPTELFDVVLVDDGGPVPVALDEPALQGRLTILRQDNAGPAAARNAGARAARGTVLAFTDDDCAPRPGWLRAFADALDDLPQHGADPPGVLLGGRTENALPGNPYARTSQELVDFLYDYYGAGAGDAPFFTSNNMAVARLPFLAAGGFDATFPIAAGEDREFGMRWRRLGGSLAFASAAVVDHAHDLTFTRFVRQHVNYGRGARQLARVLSRSPVRHRLEPARFYAGLLRYPFRVNRVGAAIAGSALMTASQVAMVWGYGSELGRQIRSSHRPPSA